MKLKCLAHSSGDFCGSQRTKIEKFRKIVNHAIELSCNIVFDSMHIPRALIVRTMTVLLCSAHDKDWDRKEEMQGGMWTMRELLCSLLFMRKQNGCRQTTEVTVRATKAELNF